MGSTTQIKVRGYHIDHYGHVNNGKYFNFFEEGRWGYFDDKRELIEYFHLHNLTHVVAMITINYKKPLVVGDTVILETEILKARRSSFTIYQTLYKNNTDVIAATAEVENVFVNAKSGRTAPMPSDLPGLWPDLGI